MAKARLIVADQHSAELDQIRRTMNALLLMIEGAEASLTAGADAEDVLNAWADGIAVGVDSNPAAIANVVATNVELVGTKPTPLHPRHPRGALRSMAAADKF
tara:strand:- start:6788 stop:7093 length:306 start_codon:yes stop_codon:yes gene_type:complete